MEGDGLAHVLLHVFAGDACGDAARQVWRIGRETGGSWFDHDEVFFHFIVASPR